MIPLTEQQFWILVCTWGHSLGLQLSFQYAYAVFETYLSRKEHVVTAVNSIYYRYCMWCIVAQKLGI